MPIDLALIHRKHQPLKFQYRNEPEWEICNSCRQPWPCDARQLLDILLTTPDVPPLLEEVRRGNSPDPSTQSNEPVAP